jgi:hypothetical protein
MRMFFFGPPIKNDRIGNRTPVHAKVKIPKNVWEGGLLEGGPHTNFKKHPADDPPWMVICTPHLYAGAGNLIFNRPTRNGEVWRRGKST